MSPPIPANDARAAAALPDGEVGDAELVAGLRRGEGAALDRAFVRHKDRLFRFLYRLAGRRDLADDLLQETFLQLARHALRLRSDTDLPAWLFTVARNAWRLSLRRQQAGERALGALPERRAGADADPERAAESSAAIARLRAALDSLSPAERELLLLAAEGELSSEQAAAVLSIRPDAFRKRLERARAALAERIAAAEEVRGDSTASRRGGAP